MEDQDDDKQPAKTHIYTGGSAREGPASWAFCVIEETPAKRFRFLGTMQGMASASPDSDDYIGAVACDNYAAEICAQTWCAVPGHDMVRF